MTTNNNPEYDRLLLDVGETLEEGRRQAVCAVNSAMVRTYWEIGRQIVEYEQHGNEKAEYGSKLLSQLSKDLTVRYGSGFGLSNISKMRRSSKLELRCFFSVIVPPPNCSSFYVPKLPLINAS